ncbi:MAG TPA: RNase P subunit p30 family protein [Candidatus Hodarchaeales archaeon]|nr:RNase P subunit p30 family protein [Candidatus Hodarchaeales archaeon]
MSFIEVGITPVGSEIDELLRMLSFARFRASLVDVNTWPANLQQPQDGAVLSLLKRVTLQDFGNKTENKNDLEAWRKVCLLLVQQCTTPEVTKWASQDQRIDALTFPPNVIHQLFDLSTARMMSDNNKILEIPLKPYLPPRAATIAIFRSLAKAVRRARIKELPVVFPSFASTKHEVVGPYEIEGFCRFIGFPEGYYFDVSQTAIASHLERNQKRFYDNYIAPGIEKVDLDQ